jgi:hypothetical protein
MIGGEFAKLKSWRASVSGTAAHPSETTVRVYVSGVDRWGFFHTGRPQYCGAGEVENVMG